MGSRGWGGAAIAALCMAFAISGCGDDEGENERSAVAELLEHVPGGEVVPLPDGQTRHVELRFVDFAAARKQLGLPHDADLARFPAGDENEQQRLATTGGLLLNYLQYRTRPAVRESIDHGAISAAAGNPFVGRPGLAVIRTSQSFEEIAAKLEGQGYTRDGNVVVHTRLERKVRDGPPRIRGSVEVLERGERSKPAPLKAGVVRRLINYPVVADGGDGAIVLGFNRRTVEDAASGSAESDDPVRALLEGVEGVARGAVAIGGNCVRALAVGESFDPETAELMIEIDGEASAERFRLPELRDKPRLEYAEPEVEGGVLTVEITGGLDPDTVGVQLAADLRTVAPNPDRIYDC